uniref:Uncharacterized protein n=1 Tax=Moniliophthora roreri TaxID=221103 RepID=A0A0W0GBF6_MONRR
MWFAPFRHLIHADLKPQEIPVTEHRGRIPPSTILPNPD